MAQLCSRCSRLNPREAIYCYHDGNLLPGHGGAGGAVNAGAQPFPSPFVFASGQSCRNFDQLATACQRHWAEACDLLRQGIFERFLGSLGRVDLAHAARAAAAFPDRDRGLDQLLGRLPAQSVQPTRLRAEPAEISLGVLRPGANQRFDLHLANQGGRLLCGAVASDCEWLSLGDGPGQAQKLFQCTDEANVSVAVRGDRLRAGAKPLEGRLLIDSNGGQASVVVRALVPVKPFPAGALAGATTPRAIAVKAKQSPKEAALLFEQGAVAQWYKDNGWTYPVQGEGASGVAAVQQFFEALGLVKPPKVEVSTGEVRLQGRAGERIVGDFQVHSRERRPVYAHARSDQPWLAVSTKQASGASTKVMLVAAVPPRPNEVLQARVHVTANGNQRFVVPVRLTVGAGGPPPVAAIPQLEILEEAVTAAVPVLAVPLPLLPAPRSPRHDDVPVRRPTRAATALPLAVHAIPGGLLGLVVLFLLLRDVIFAPGLPVPTPARTQVQIEGQDIHEPGPAGGGPDIAAVPIDPNPRIRYGYDEIRRFGVTVTDTGKRLTYNPQGRTNMTVVQVDGGVETFGVGGQWLTREEAPPVLPNQPAASYRSKNVWLDRLGIQLTQVLDIVPSKQPVEVAPGVQKRLLETCLAAFQIENKDARPHRVGLRLEIDTLIGRNDGVPFAVPGQPGLVDSVGDYRLLDKNFPDFIQALEFPNLEHPGTIAHLTVKVGGGLEPPDRISLVHWTGGFSDWEVPLRPMGNDSAVILYWYAKELRPGERRAVGFAYGLGAVASDAKQGKGKLGLTLSGGFEPGEVFTVTAYVNGATPGQTLTLQLPAGLERKEGEAQQPVPPPGNGAASLVTWRVRVLRTGRFPLEVRSSNGLSQRRVLTVARPDPGKRPDNADSIFR